MNINEKTDLVNDYYGYIDFYISDYNLYFVFSTD